MVKETHVVFGPGDVARIRFQCTNCDGEVTQGLTDRPEMPTNCPLCNQQWRPPHEPSTLNELARSETSGNNPVRVRLELDGEDD